ncbi:DUF250 domain membrane protein [Truncatella angustata]|uniref:DUF250 domain membrane protein n=1 Tax=Truncatella angustata TaxID=152316 RepID=A0A9P8ZU91_9PEZI|nr:DUF250 domain membrane protein [Truncatella angustata]KAH6648981.1 DUF250 domain membrane protein [Truncatella angustata]
MPQPLLPPPSVAEKERRAGLSLPPAAYVSLWIFFSNITILFNKWLIDDAGFREFQLLNLFYTILLTVWHMVFASLATQILARTTSWLDGRHQVQMTRRFYLRAVVPIALLYSGSMVCSNLVYLYLNVVFIQMLKAAAPFFTLAVAWLWGQEDPTREKVFKVLVIVSGVLLASAGEIHFSTIGLFFQLGGLVFESLRVVMVKELMTDAGANMDPLVSLYYYAPMCAVTNIFVAFGAEWPTFKWSDVENAGLAMLVLNAFVAFCLNVSGVLLIGKTSALIQQVCGVLKNILLVIVSVIIWGTVITPLQTLGYTLALIGMVFYRATWQDIKKGAVGLAATYRNAPKSRGYNSKQSSALIRRVTVAIVILLLVVIMFFACVRSDRVQLQPWSLSGTSTSEKPEHPSLSWLSRLGYGR